MSLTSSSLSADRDVITLDTATFTDFIIRCEDIDLAVNRCIIGRHSEVVRRFILANPTEHSFRLEHELATASVGRLLLRAIYYEKWDKTMDKHAQDLLRLAYFYKSERVKRSAVESLNRQLDASNFRQIFDLALTLNNAALIAVCDASPLHSVQIFVRTTAGKTITIDVNSSSTVRELKVKVQDKEGIPTTNQRLVYAGRPLVNDKLLTDYGIYREATVHMS